MSHAVDQRHLAAPEDTRGPAPAEGPALAQGSAPAQGRQRAIRHRIFVAVELAAPLREATLGARDHVKDAAERVRWVSPNNLHLTLKFLGEITDAQVTRATEAVREAAERVEPFTITLEGLGAFPSPHRPRVVWIGVTEGADLLVALAGALDAAMQRRRFPREQRPFQPHLTVARVRGEGPPPDLTESLAGAGRPRFGTQPVDALVVVESTLGPSGPTYREVAKATLRGAER